MKKKPGSISQFDYIQFSAGPSLRQRGDALPLCENLLNKGDFLKIRKKILPPPHFQNRNEGPGFQNKQYELSATLDYVCLPSTFYFVCINKN